MKIHKANKIKIWEIKLTNGNILNTNYIKTIYLYDKYQLSFLIASII